jgi:DNA-directed RNA polymerase specialized sigma24 family protein
VVFVDDYSTLEADDDTPDRETEAQQIDELVEWVRQRARVRDDAARLVVMTRVAGVSVDEVAAAQGVDPQTLRQRRLRTEHRVRQSLVLSR